jgi:2-(1,2-epoxy-1,2-dihydrophenyl)acetyl-CoA isomerase
MTLTIDDGLATIALNRPEAMNALNLQLKGELARTIAELAVDPAARAVLITGNGRAFCSGGDIKEMDPDRTQVVSRQRLTKLLGEIFIPLARMEKPVIAAVNGHAHGAGMSLALAADVIYAGESAVFSLAFSRLGLVPDSCALYFLPRRLPVDRCKELIFSARRFGAAEARELGLVTKVLPDDELLPAATALGREWATGATVAFGLAKRLLDQSTTLTMEDMAQLEMYAQGVAISTEDHAEGLRAFAEKRAAVFRGR